MKMKAKATNKLLIILLTFLMARAVGIFLSGVLDGIATALAVPIAYILIYAFLSERKEENKSVGFVQGLIAVILFLSVDILLSRLIGLFFETEGVEITLVGMILSVVLVPIAEELFFRGTLFSFLDGFVPTWVAVVFSSLLFALSHPTFPSIIAAFLLGILLTLIYKKTNSIALTVACHSANNLLACLDVQIAIYTPTLILAFGVVFFLVRKEFCK